MSIKVIAFYLPQFHQIPENDEAHGYGFTEWTNVRKAIPLFEGHYQPRIPLDKNYYCLLDSTIMRKQAELAKSYGIYGFCYYHYWFKSGKKLLEKPIENMLNDPSIDIPFCLCWANENWTKRWDGGNNEIIVEQDYGDETDLLNHVDYLCRFFSDKRYIKIDNKPLLIIYKPDLIPHLNKYIKKIRNRVKVNGFDGLVLASQYPKYYVEGVRLNLFDLYIQFQPRFVPEDEANERKGNVTKTVKKVLISCGFRNFGKSIRNIFVRKNNKKELTRRDYSKDWEYILNYKVKLKQIVAGAFVDWDNTPRNRVGLVYDGVSPELFCIYMKKLVDKVKKEYDQQMIFVNAWNEWAEGAYLEPDEKNGYKFLEAIKEAISVYE